MIESIDTFPLSFTQHLEKLIHACRCYNYRSFFNSLHLLPSYLANFDGTPGSYHKALQSKLLECKETNPITIQDIQHLHALFSLYHELNLSLAPFFMGRFFYFEAFIQTVCSSLALTDTEVGRLPGETHEDSLPQALSDYAIYECIKLSLKLLATENKLYRESATLAVTALAKFQTGLKSPYLTERILLIRVIQLVESEPALSQTFVDESLALFPLCRKIYLNKAQLIFKNCQETLAELCNQVKMLQNTTLTPQTAAEFDAKCTQIFQMKRDLQLHVQKIDKLSSLQNTLGAKEFVEKAQQAAAFLKKLPARLSKASSLTELEKRTYHASTYWFSFRRLFPLHHPFVTQINFLENIISHYPEKMNHLLTELTHTCRQKDTHRTLAAVK